MNIFETIGSVTHRVEPYHSQFLADALRDSLEGDRSLFEAFWKLAAPQWEVPGDADIMAEEIVESGRVDICIRSDYPYKRLVGVEVKTADTSALHGQLERYREGLERKFSQYTIQISYLTPFNRERAGDTAHSLHAVRIFEDFAKVFRDARHLSWLDVADIPWDGNVLWKQHHEYVKGRISPPSVLEKTMLNRDLSHFFGEEATGRFYHALAGLGIHLGEDATVIDLSEYENLSSFARCLVDALKILLHSDNVSHNADKSDKFAAELRHRFLDSKYHEVHEALFDLSRQFPHVWIQGERDYAVRTAHKNHRSNGVSLLRSHDPGRLEVRMRR